MKTRLKGNALIGQSGGPTVVINQSLVGVVQEALRHPEIRKIYGGNLLRVLRAVETAAGGRN